MVVAEGSTAGAPWQTALTGGAMYSAQTTDKFQMLNHQTAKQANALQYRLPCVGCRIAGEPRESWLRAEEANVSSQDGGTDVETRSCSHGRCDDGGSLVEDSPESRRCPEVRETYCGVVSIRKGVRDFDPSNGFS